MAATASKLLELARAEIGVKESPPGSNKVKYNDAYGHGDIAWCCVFLWWLFQQAGSPELFFNGKKTAYCPALQTYHTQIGQAVSGDYRPGDIVFFDFNSNGMADHVGLCESFDGTYVTTIDGNTGTTSESNGECVMRRKRLKKYIVGVIRPAYESEDDEDMDQSKFNEMFKAAMNEYRRELRDNDSGSWSEQARAWAVSVGLFAGGDPLENGEPNYMWEDLMTREQAAVLFYKFATSHGLA